VPAGSYRFALPLILLLVLAACGGGASPSAAESEAQSQGASASAGTGMPELPEPETTEISIGVAAFQVGTLPARIAAVEGIYEKWGLEVELVQFEGDGPAAQALAAGQIDGFLGGGGPVLSSNAAGERVVTVMVTLDVPTDSLVVPDDVQSADDLRGQPIAISTFGGDSHTAVVLALESLGLTQDDVVITQIGGQGDRYAALLAGAVSGAPVEGIPEEQMEADGVYPLVDLIDTGLRLQRAGLILNGDFIDENPNTTLRLVASIYEGFWFQQTNTDRAVEIFAELGEITLEEAEPQVAPLTPLIDPSGMATAEMFELQQEVLAVTNEAILDVDPNDMFTNEFLEQLEEYGFYEYIGRD
jgi:NitT/TauT family transport system substrate-binding protein